MKWLTQPAHWWGRKVWNHGKAATLQQAMIQWVISYVTVHSGRSRPCAKEGARGLFYPASISSLSSFLPRTPGSTTSTCVVCNPAALNELLKSVPKWRVHFLATVGWPCAQTTLITPLASSQIHVALRNEQKSPNKRVTINNNIIVFWASLLV